MRWTPPTKPPGIENYQKFLNRAFGKQSQYNQDKTICLIKAVVSACIDGGAPWPIAHSVYLARSTPLGSFNSIEVTLHKDIDGFFTLILYLYLEYRDIPLLICTSEDLISTEDVLLERVIDVCSFSDFSLTFPS